MLLNPVIVNGIELRSLADTAGKGNRKIMGEYDRRRFSLSLSPEVSDALQLSAGDTSDREVIVDTLEVAQAMSTYLHETIHWWQHIGSTAGLLQTAVFPSSTHVNYAALMRILGEYGPQKSLHNLSVQETIKTGDNVSNDLNYVVNNAHDLKNFVLAVQSPLNYPTIQGDRFFEGRGHAFTIAYQALLSAIQGLDPNHSCFPDAREWADQLAELKNRKQIEFYYGSPIFQPPVGLISIFEGQARFSQMQYLHKWSDGALDWSDFKKAGMLAALIHGHGCDSLADVA